MDSRWPLCRPVNELRPGDHAWLAYQGEDERRQVAEAFVGTGPAGGADRIVLLGGAADGGAPADDRVAVLPWDAGPSALERALTAEIAAAERGVRLLADLTGTLRRPGGLPLVLECERVIARVVGASAAVIAVCQFDRRAGAPDQLAALRAEHAVSVVPEPVLRIDRTSHPAGLALGGELDASRHAEFRRALSGLLAHAGGDPVHLDLADLEFIDLGALELLTAAAARHPRRGPLVLDRVPERLRTIIETVGWDMFPGLEPGVPHPGR
ncbi:STAS domain-containing protein [Thermomonospora amylolytica]|uniref:STAS domain-containing protein n=1 Tax=Thermomonospora amylolytica TaxID=1411117 RepID=UPI000E6C7A92|nr:STAS domain-containing protein [Thermomonospora amylolytica]